MTIITILSILTALLVVTSTSTVYSVLWLVSTFLIISALLGLLNLGFTALLYIIVYVGAIAILFLFVVQLLDLGSVSEQPVILENNESYNASKGITPLAIIISLALFTILIVVAATQVFNTEAIEWAGLSLFYNNSISLDTLITNIEVINNNNIVSQGNSPQVESIAQWFYGPGLLPLIIISIILLVAMIAPISLCKDND